MPTVTRTNLCTNPSLEAGITGWSAAGTPAPAIAQSAVWAQDRTKSLLITWAAGNTFFPGAAITVSGLTSGATYTFSAYINVPAGNPKVQLIADGSGLLAGSPISATNTPGERLSVTFVATATSHRLLLAPNGTPTAGQLCYLDAILAEQTNVAASYFDGASSGCVWTGTADLSTSQQLSGPLSITTSVDLANEPPRVAIFVSGASGTTAQITRTDPDGGVRPVRGGDPAPLVGGQAILYDYEMPYGATTTYTVIDAGGPTAFTATAAVATTQARLIHPGQPSLSIQIDGIKRTPRDFASGAAAHPVLGSQYPVVVTDGQRKAAKYQVSIRTQTSTDNANVKAILAGCVPLLLQIVFPFTSVTSWQYVNVDNVTETEVTQRFGDHQRVWTLDVSATDRPVGGIAAQRTWADVLGEVGTWADLTTRYTTWSGVVTGVPHT